MADNPLMKCPPQLRNVQHFLKLAVDYEARQPFITYWARLYSLQSALKIDKKSPEARTLLANLMDWLETFKKENMDDESITSDVAGQALLENEANKLFEWADASDRAGTFNKNVVKSFYTCGVMLDVCQVFGELSEEVQAQRKYAKWKATYIHNCLKSGEQPVPGPIGGEETDEFGDVTSGGIAVPPPGAPAPTGFEAGLPQLPTFEPSPPAFQANTLPAVDASSPAHTSSVQPAAGNKISAVDLKQARKLCKWADSALDYEDVTTAVENLSKALILLQPYSTR